MRSSKSRSRSKSNRNRPSGNVVNRVFDSSGPEGKVRGTPQQIIDKYNQLARDAQLSGDRVAFENFQQHAEHYTRMLGEAQREMEARREQQEREQRERQQQNQQNQQAQPRREDGDGDKQPPAPAPATSGDTVVEDAGANAGDAGLVETPENAEPKARRQRRPRAPKPATQPAPEAAPQPDVSEAPAPPQTDPQEAAE